MPYDVQDFEAEVIQASHERPIVVDFWAEWCAPCRILGPILEKLAAESEDRWRLAKVDTERFPEEASRYGVRGIPNVKLFVDGAPVGEFVGALPESLVRDWLGRMIPTDADRSVARALGEAKRFLDQGRFGEAQKELEAALEISPEDPKLKLELARVVVFDDPTRARSLLDHLDTDPADQDSVDAVNSFARLFEVERQPEAPKVIEVERYYLQAVQRLKARDFVGALEGILQVLREGSGSIREEAGELCAEVFQYLGSSHPVVTRFRGEVASALYR